MCIISIIIPIFNTSKVLNRCLDSVVRQTYADWECLLIDDGATDGSGAICDEYAKKDSRFRVFHLHNRGVSAARNVGLDNARGEWITFIDSDDWVEKDLLKDYAEKLSGVDIVMQNAIWHGFRLNGNLFYRNVNVNDCLTYQEKIAKLYKLNFLGYIWSSILKRDIIERNHIRFNEDFKWSEDWHFILRYCLFAKEIIVLPVRNYHYMFPQKNDFRSYRDYSISRLHVVCENADLITQIVGDDLAKSIDRTTSAVTETINMYKSHKYKKSERTDALQKYTIPCMKRYKCFNHFLVIINLLIQILPMNAIDCLLLCIYSSRK